MTTVLVFRLLPESGLFEAGNPAAEAIARVLGNGEEDQLTRFQIELLRPHFKLEVMQLQWTSTNSVRL